MSETTDDKPAFSRARIKSAAELAEHTETGNLHRTMGLWSLVALSVGATVGSSIFVILGEAVPMAGPAVVVSFIIVGAVAALSALSYAELAGMIPSSGSSYSYAYASMGEFPAWMVGWMLFLMYGVSVAAMAVPWGQYVQNFLDGTVGWRIPENLAAGPAEGGLINLPALIVVLMATALLLRGTHESAKVNNALVAMKLIVLALFAIIAFTAFDAGNLHPFAPMGMSGISSGATVLMFSYLGFDAASTAGEEAKDAKRDLPRAILISMVIVTAVYVLTSLAAVGALNWTEFADQPAVLSHILFLVTGSSAWSAVLSAVAVVSIFSVIFITLYGQTRIAYAMSRDGLVPASFGRVNRKQVPITNTVVTMLVVAGLAAFVPFEPLLDAVNLGTFMVFIAVSAAVLMLRYTERGRGLNRTYTVPFGPTIPVLAIMGLLYLVLQEGADALITFAIYSLLGMSVYWLYGFKHSHMAPGSETE